MLALLAMLSYNIANGNITDGLHGTQPGGYYEITQVQCEQTTNKTYSIGVRYEVDWNGSGHKQILFTDVRNFPGCVSKKTIANTIIADSYIKVLDK